MYSELSIIRTSIIQTLNYPDPRLSGSRTEIIASTYNDLRMRVVAVDNMAAKSVVLSTEDRQVVGQGCLPLSSTCSSACSQQLALPCSQQLVSAYGPYFHLSGLFTYPAWFSHYFGQRGPDNRGSTVLIFLLVNSL